jgi:predicted alpha/beta hydrolase family esterase
MNLERAIIVHGWEGHPEDAWFPWLKKELEKLGMEVEVPQMPDTDNPSLGKWLMHLEKVVGDPDENLVIIGHSLANITTLRFLEGLPEGKRIGKLVMVGGYTDDLGYKEFDSFFQTPIEWDKIKQHCRDFVAIHSDNDQYVPLKHADIFKERLGAKVIIEHDKRHMGPEDKLMELPSALESVKE